MSIGNPIDRNFQIENKEQNENALKCVNGFVLNHEYKGNIRDKKQLYSAVQNEWHEWAVAKGVTQEISKDDTLEYIKEISARLQIFGHGFGSSPKLYEMLPQDVRGIDCISASMILGSILEKEGIEYNFISPVQHVALLVEIQSKPFYIDATNNKFIDLSGIIKESVLDSKEFDILYLTDNVAAEGYSFVSKYKHKEDILGSVFGNIIVLNDLVNGDTSNASHTVDTQMKAASAVETELMNIDFKKVVEYKKALFSDFEERNEKMCIAEEQRLKDIGFYSS